MLAGFSVGRTACGHVFLPACRQGFCASARLRVPIGGEPSSAWRCQAMSGHAQVRHRIRRELLPQTMQTGPTHAKSDIPAFGAPRRERTAFRASGIFTGGDANHRPTDEAPTTPATILNGHPRKCIDEMGTLELSCMSRPRRTGSMVALPHWHHEGLPACPYAHKWACHQASAGEQGHVTRKAKRSCCRAGRWSSPPARMMAERVLRQASFRQVETG